MRIVEYHNYSDDDFKEIIERRKSNLKNREYFEHIEEIEPYPNLLIFIEDKWFEKNYNIKNYEDFIHSFYLNYFGGWGPQPYYTKNKYLNENCVPIKTYTCSSSMRSFEDLFCLVTTYFPETYYLDIFESLFKLIKVNKNWGAGLEPIALAYHQFYYCDDINKINILDSQRQVRVSYDEELHLKEILEDKLNAIENADRNFKYEKENDWCNSLYSWGDLLNQYLEYKDISLDVFKTTFKQRLITEDSLCGE